METENQPHATCAVCGAPCCPACSWHHGRKRYECEVCDDDAIAARALTKDTDPAKAITDMQSILRDVIDNWDEFKRLAPEADEPDYIKRARAMVCNH